MSTVQEPVQAEVAAPALADENLVESGSKLVEYIVDWLGKNGMDIAVNLLTALAILVIGWWLAKFLTGILRRVLKKHVDETLTSFVCSLAKMGLVTLVIITAIGRLGVETTSFVAILGAAGLAVGFALQGSLANFASGVMLIFFRPFVAGDYVEAGGTAGVVLEVGIFATVLKTPDNKRITIPNSGITDGTIINFSAHDTRRVDLVFGIGYDDDIKKAKEILMGILTADERVLSDPAPVVAVGELADSSVNFICRPWVKTDDYWGVYWDVTEQVKLQFDAAGVSIPFPQQDVHMHEVA
jgi:small conductance mechanosensitive channel